MISLELMGVDASMRPDIILYAVTMMKGNAVLPCLGRVEGIFFYLVTKYVVEVGEDDSGLNVCILILGSDGVLEDSIRPMDGVLRIQGNSMIE